MLPDLRHGKFQAEKQVSSEDQVEDFRPARDLTDLAVLSMKLTRIVITSSRLGLKFRFAASSGDRNSHLGRKSICKINNKDEDPGYQSDGNPLFCW